MSRRAHAKLAPSAAHRWMECPGSVMLSQDFEDKSSEDAKLGTFAHEVADLCLALGLDASALIGHTDTVEGSDFELSEEDAEHVQSYLDVVRELEDGCEESFYEERVYSAKDPHIYGTADAIIRRPDVLDVVDLKFGAGLLVDPRQNPQLRIYALCTLDTLNIEPEVIRCHVVQPRHYRNVDGDGHDFEEITLEDLRDWELRLADAARATRVPCPALAAGDWCHFCPAAAHCPELERQALSVAQDAFRDLGDPQEPPEPHTLSAEQLGQALDVFPRVENWMKAVRAYAHAEAGEGRVDGWKLVEKTGNRKWTDANAQKTIERLVRKAGKDPFESKLISPARADKILGSSTVNLHTEKPVTGLSLVPEDDARPAFNAADVFDAIDE